MIPILYDKSEINFSSLGLGKMTETLSSVTTEIANGTYENITIYSANGKLAELIDNEMQIKVKPNDRDEPHVFRIYDFEVDTVLNEIRIYSQSRTNDLGSNAIKNIVITDQTVQSALDDLKANLIEPTDISLVSDIPTKSSTKWSNRNPLNCIAGEQGSIIQIWGGEIQRDSRTIYVYKRRGLDNVGTIREGKHIEGLTISYSIDNLVTKIIPFRTYRDNEDFDTEIVEYGDEVVSPLHDKYSVSYIRFIDYSLDSDVRDLTSMNTKASNYFSSNTGIDEPRMTVDLDMLDLSKSADYKDKFKDFETFGLFDTIQVYSKKYNMILNAKINKVVYDSLNERNIELSIGNYRTGLIESVTSSYNSALEQKEKEINNQLYVAIRSADRKSTNFYGEAEPVGALKDGDIWFKPTGDGHYQMYKYYSGSWGDPIIDTRQTDHLQTEILTVQSQAQQAVDEAEKATNEAVKAITALEETNSTIAQITDGDVTAYNQKISTALGDIQMIKDADYSTQISTVAGRINVQIVDNADGTKSMMDMTSNQLLYNIDGGKIQITKDKFYIDQTLIVPIIQTTKLSATQIESGTLDASKANIINLNVANLVGQNADLIRGSFNAINSSINIDGTALTTKGNWGGDIKLSNRGLTIYDNLANQEMGVLYGLFRNPDDPLKDRSMLATGLFAGSGYKLNLGLKNETNNGNYSVISIGRAEENGFPQMNVFGDIIARYDLKMMGGMLTGAANAGYTVTEAKGGYCIEFANGWKIQFYRSSYQTYSEGWTTWSFAKKFESIPIIALAQAIRDDVNMTLCNVYHAGEWTCTIRIQNKTLPWTILAIAIGR